MTTQNYMFVVEHMDPELEDWQAIEYKCIAKECLEGGAQFLLTSISPNVNLPAGFNEVAGLHVDERNAETIFADRKDRVCLLDPAATKELNHMDSDRFEIFLFGGILGDDPPRDRTAELRHLGFEGRQLGKMQMTTDTAVRVSRKIIQNKMSLLDLEFIDHPEIKISAHESAVMPFRYIKDGTGGPILPEGMLELLKKDSDKGLDDVL